MSQTLLETSTAAEKKKDDPFADNRKRLFQMIEDGKSWSGRERNCAFLNTGGTFMSTAILTTLALRIVTGGDL